MYTLSTPGPVAARQGSPHPHQALFDPTWKYVVVPDLGADLVRTYSAASDSLSLTELNAYDSLPGAGPRHGVFSLSGKYYYLMNELSNVIEVFEVSYTPVITLTRVDSISVYPAGTPAIVNATSAEIAISHDGKYLYSSNRLDGTFPDARVAPPPSTETVLSDSISVFSIKKDGKLVFLEQSPVGGQMPRHFSIDPQQDGMYVAVATQLTGRIAIYKRDKHSGKLDKVPVASIDLTAFGVTEPICVTWLD